MDWQLLKRVGLRVYKCEDWRDYKRYYVFLARCWMHQSAVERHVNFLTATPDRKEIAIGCPWLVDQATRQVFYKGSTMEERIALVEQHILYMEKLFKPEVLHTLYTKGHRILLWRDTFDDKPLSLYMVFWSGQQKEGCLSLDLVYENTDLEHVTWDYGPHVYQVIFTLGKDCITDTVESPEQLSAPTIRIGALQGLAGGEALIKKLTKHYFGYRPKNLILWCLRCFAVAIGAKGIIAVSNNGHYAMNHFRMNRKLKVDLDKFWLESGEMTADPRFYNIPIAEYRKEMSEMKPSKRANHRRRYELMDRIQDEISESVDNCMNQKTTP